MRCAHLSRSAYTVVELLAVVAILAVLLALITGVAAKVRPRPEPETQAGAGTPGAWGATCCLAPVASRGVTYGDRLINSPTGTQYYQYTLPAGRYVASCTSAAGGNFKATITYGSSCAPTDACVVIGQLNGGDSYTFTLPAAATICVACYVISPAASGDYTFSIN